MNRALLSSKDMNWCTPQDFFDTLNQEFHFALDAAATDKTAKCPLYFTPETDGLKSSWDVHGAVFCNPPYGREIGKWVRKAYEEAQKGTTIVLLIPARTDTSYFHEYIYGKAELRFIRGRLRFTDSDGNPADPAPFPSMLVIYNGDKAKKGHVYRVSIRHHADGWVPWNILTECTTLLEIQKALRERRRSYEHNGNEIL